MQYTGADLYSSDPFAMAYDREHSGNSCMVYYTLMKQNTFFGEAG